MAKDVTAGIACRGRRRYGPQLYDPVAKRRSDALAGQVGKREDRKLSPRDEKVDGDPSGVHVPSDLPRRTSQPDGAGVLAREGRR